MTYADLGPAEVAIVMREAGAAIRRGDYRPGPSRRVPIPKAAGGTRTLTVANLADRVVGAALADVLEPTFEATFRPGSYGFRPGLGTWRLLADLEASLAARRLTTLAIDDVRRAFDFVPIALLMEIFCEHIADPRLLHLIEAVLRGGADRDRAVGIPQGSPLSPLALNVILHQLHDAPLAGDVTSPPWYRYADNLAYACRGVPEGNLILDRVRDLLAPAGLRLKGADGPPVDLHAGEAQLLGFRLKLRGHRLQLALGEDARAKLIHGMEEAHAEPEPPRVARAIVRGWIESHGPAFANRREIARTATEIHRAGATLGFRELGPADDLRGRCTAAHLRWIAYREGATGRRGADIHHLRKLAKITYPICYSSKLRSWILVTSLFVERPGTFAGRFGLGDASGRCRPWNVSRGFCKIVRGCAMPAYSDDQISAFEAANALRLPGRLSSFLREHGPGRYGDIEIHPLEQVYGIYADFFDEPGDLFSRWLPFGCNNLTQEIWVLDISEPPPKFAKIWHETVPDDWADEGWRAFADCADPELASVGI